MWKQLTGFAGAVLWIGVSTGYAQEDPPPVHEIGAQVTLLNLREFSVVLGRRNELAVGGRFTLNLTDLIAAEAQVDLYPNDRFFDYRRKIQGLFGIKMGVRQRRVGAFGKLRPGFIHVRDRGQCAIPEGCGLTPPGYTNDYFGRFWFALDAGAVVELYPSTRVALRADLGDLFVRRFDGTDGTGRRVFFLRHTLATGG